MHVVAVSKSSLHTSSKENHTYINLVERLGVEVDRHFGKTVQHLSRIAVDPTQPNLRQVHLIHSELLGELNLEGFDLVSGQLG